MPFTLANRMEREDFAQQASTPFDLADRRRTVCGQRKYKIGPLFGENCRYMMYPRGALDIPLKAEKAENFKYL